METEELREDIALWHQSDLTRRFAKSASQNALEFHAQLISACNTSPDANVRAALERFSAWNDMAQLLGGKHVRVGE